ncbi:MAG TPA: 2-polyprenylphenol 6-hydroxylase [Caulobacteraceae bacterium]|jgi:ubiquinone biosynthesis protein|nr:2-polyprenylphenol 6-hydroxylase [Caulobacteraceae bacterium]
MARLGSYARLAGVAWVLIRADALAPRELDPLMPAGARTLARFLRLFRGREARAGRPGERLATALERLGPVGIKLGQFLSTRADIFGAEFADDLSRLKDRLPAFPLSEAKAEVAAALGEPLDAVFAEFDEALAAASLAQAHRAKLKSGRQVAVKVLRPGIERRVAADSDVLRTVAGLAEAWAPAARRLEPRAFAETVVRALELELDLRFEAAGADELRAIMAHDNYMRAPAVVWEGVARRVLTLEWAPGVALSNPAALALPGLDRPALANNIIRAFLAQALDHGVFHADLHEGNLFVAAPARVTAVDFGIVGRLGPGERRYLAEILWGFLRRDYPRVARVHFDAGYVPEHHSEAAFAQALRAVGEPVIGARASDVSMGRLLAQLFEITALFDMRLRPELVLLQKTMVTVEGVARRLDPHHDIWAAAEPVVARWIARELSPAAKLRVLVREGRAALTTLARMAEPAAEAEPAPVPVIEPARPSALAALWFVAGAALSALAFAAALHWRVIH